MKGDFCMLILKKLVVPFNVQFVGLSNRVRCADWDCDFNCKCDCDCDDCNCICDCTVCDR